MTSDGCVIGLRQLISATMRVVREGDAQSFESGAIYLPSLILYLICLPLSPRDAFIVENATQNSNANNSRSHDSVEVHTGFLHFYRNRTIENTPHCFELWVCLKFEVEVDDV
jgi:hypothetical protein